MEWYGFLLFPLVGAAIGAITNQIAIRMLFRPYHPIRVAGLRLPFTPGVIPARREALAKSIATAVERNLLSGEEIHALITGDATRGIIVAKVDDFFTRLGPLAAMASGFKPKIVTGVMEAIEQVASEALTEGGELDIAHRIEQRVHSMDLARLEALILDVTRKQLQHITLFGGVIGAGIGLVQAALNLWLPSLLQMPPS